MDLAWFGLIWIDFVGLDLPRLCPDQLDLTSTLPSLTGKWQPTIGSRIRKKAARLSSALPSLAGKSSLSGGEIMNFLMAYRLKRADFPPTQFFHLWQKIISFSQTRGAIICIRLKSTSPLWREIWSWLNHGVRPKRVLFRKIQTILDNFE